jgi:hypothetical protein
MRIAHAGASTGEIVSIERQNNLGLVEAILRRDVLSEDTACTSVEIIPVHWLIPKPLGF